ncbi:4Fe-4S binding protein [Bacillus sp. DNRA2]|uniref:4Fe-4S binding protein n=1 Tax=Bacillus sp. DNRA2 TaxID=2723053 RepID=UPI00145C7BDB|nr:4Fe-4S binding protein [Bacillus sp. DNRA2]NMD69741.1 4Fe-4S binding protein [Bacillus sp. DNRA2]
MKSKKLYKQLKRRPIEFARGTVQLLFLFFILYVGLRFYLFYQHFATSGVMPFVERPSAVEGFLPVSALVGFKVWVSTGEFDQIHPAGLVLFTFIVGSGLLFRRSFCSWICPIGTISEWTGKLGSKLTKKFFKKKTIDLPKWLTWILSPIKYLILAFFLKYILLDMSPAAALDFMYSQYNVVSDAKMLLFFVNISSFAVKVILVLFVLSLFFKNFWCRFLCPYGAVIGLGSLLGITKIKRNEDTCIDCSACTRVCPQRIKVSEKKAVLTPECSACMLCVEACPVKDTLTVQVAGKKVNKWVVPAAFFVVFAVTYIIARLTGHWQTILTYDDFKYLFSMLDNIGH